MSTKTRFEEEAKGNSEMAYFHISRILQSGTCQGEVDVYRFISKHGSDHFVLFLLRSLVTPRHRCILYHE